MLVETFCWFIVMRHPIFLLALSALLLLQACKEKAPPIILNETVAVDSYYTVQVPVAEPHNVLIENFTGATCTNCPAAHDFLHGLDTQNRGRINIINLYIKNFPQTIPPNEAKYDFRTDDATTLRNSVFQSLPSMPIAGIDRAPWSTVTNRPLLYNKSDWATIVNTRKSATDSFNVTLMASFDDAANKANIDVAVTYLFPTTALLNLSVAIVEDSMVDHQEYPSYTDTAYLFTDVLRAYVTAVPFGDPVAPKLTTKPAGQVYKRHYTYQLPAKGTKNSWNPRHCKVIAYIHQDGAKGGIMVYQSKQVHLLP